MTSFFSFLEAAQQKSEAQFTPVIALTGRFPSLFFSHFWERYQTGQTTHVQKIMVSQLELPDLMSTLGTTFLGQTYVYWMFGIELMSQQQAGKLLEYLSEYSGPHILIVVTPDELPQLAKKKITHVAIPQTLTKKEVDLVVQCLYPDQAQNLSTKLHAASLSSEYTLDIVALLLSYVRLIGSSIDEFKREWSPKLLPAEHSLFTLSALFFAQQKEQFFTLWAAVRSDYPDQFWITFFSDQLFKAHGFIWYSRNNNHLAAKKMGYRLPFSFMRTDWKKYPLEHIVRTHDLLYTMDHQIKNGGSEHFDLLFAHFFNL